MARGTNLSIGFALALGAPFALADTLELERVEITGSSIKRSDIELPAPVEIVTREQIRRTGATSVNELLKSIPVIDIDDTGELATARAGASGFVFGTARARLRGLGDTQALVLINGRRVPSNPFADTSGAGAAFNVNQIPVAAIDRIEILKDSGSAIYGADAVGGVVNFILRRDWRGVTVSALAGQSSRGDADEWQAGAHAGWGDLAADGFNVFASLDVFRRDPYLRRDREISRSADFRRFGPVPGFNLDARSTFALEGNILNLDGTTSGVTVQPCAPENFSGNACRFDFNASQLTGYNGTDRLGALLGGALRVGNDTTVFARLLHSRDETVFHGHPLISIFGLPDGRNYSGMFVQGGNGENEQESRFNHVEVGADGSIGTLEWRAGASSSRVDVDIRLGVGFARDPFILATQGDPANGIAPTIDPTSTTNDPALIDALRVSPTRAGRSTNDQIDGQLSDELFGLPGGVARYAVGASVSRESLSDALDPLWAAGGVYGAAARSSVTAERTARALFAELQLPITSAIEGQLAARYDRDDTADRVSPKAALKWQALPALLLRASYSESFKMPTLKQLYATIGQRPINLTESQCTGIGLPAGCAGTPARVIAGANPLLAPEVGRSFNVGFVVEGGPLSLTVDFWRIAKEDNIATPTVDEAIRQGFYRFDPSGGWFVLQTLQNFAQSRNSGGDLDARMRFAATPLGDVTIRLATTYTTQQAVRASAASPWLEFSGTYAKPRWRATLAASADQGAWTSTALVRATAGFYDTVLPREQFGALPPEGLRSVPAYWELDVTVSYRASRSLTLIGSVKNLLDRMPPFSATNATNAGFTQQGFAELYTARGRYFQAGVEFAF
jgi:iron complex outermembrane recepter protein